LPGFKDAPKGFKIEKYTIDSLYNEKINKIIQEFPKETRKQKIFYSVCHHFENREGGDEFEILGVFSNEEKAKNALRNLLKLEGFQSQRINLDVYVENTSIKEWCEGFIKWAPTDKEKSEWGLNNSQI
jgi:hypothetical protein